MIKVGDLVRLARAECLGEQVCGVVTCLDPEEIGDDGEVLVMWLDGEVHYHSDYTLEVVSESR